MLTVSICILDENPLDFFRSERLISFSQNSADSIICYFLFSFLSFFLIESKMKIMIRSLNVCHYDSRRVPTYLILACIVLMFLYPAIFVGMTGEVSLPVELPMTLYGFLWRTMKVRYVIVLAFQDVRVQHRHYS
jgi:hypothetical protein